MDFSRICRLCLKSDENSIDIYTSFYSKTSKLYSEMLINCTKLKVTPTDNLPRIICKDCCRQLRRTYAFNIQCETSDTKLRHFLDRKDFDSKGIIEKEIKECLKFDGNSEEIDSKNGIKFEHVNYSDELIKEDINLIKDVPDVKHLVKDEQNDEDNHGSAYDQEWDEDDDSTLLEIKFTTNPDDRIVSNGEEPIKKKRGRKKKDLAIISNGEEPPRKRGRKRVYAIGEVPDSKAPQQCDICGKILSTKSNLKAHKICHTDQRPYKCSTCPATFKGHSALTHHHRLHTNVTPFHCEFCPKQFRRRAGLVNHIRIHTGEKLFGCDICAKKFIQSGQLSNHMKRHKGDKPFLCQDCGKGFPLKADLRVHQRIHNGEKPYSCHLCTKTFATSGNLSIHIRIHNKEIRYNCKICQRGFVTRSSFNVHIKRHKGQRDYHCECGKTFYTSSSLKQHKIVHTGDKRYQCKICERKFSQSSHLSRHFKRSHMKPNDPVPSSEHYKKVLESGVVLSVFNDSTRNSVPECVKCENV